MSLQSKSLIRRKYHHGVFAILAVIGILSFLKNQKLISTVPLQFFRPIEEKQLFFLPQNNDSTTHSETINIQKNNNLKPSFTNNSDYFQHFPQKKQQQQQQQQQQQLHVHRHRNVDVNNKTAQVLAANFNLKRHYAIIEGSSSSFSPKNNIRNRRHKNNIVTNVQSHRVQSNYITKKNFSSNIIPWTCETMDNKTVTIAGTVPHFIIAGTQKGGTTALRQILRSFQNFIPSLKPEPHFFDWKTGIRKSKIANRPNNLLDNDEKQRCSFRHKYVGTNWHSLDTLQRFETKFQSPIITFEKTPSYIAEPFVPNLIHEVYTPPTKIINDNDNNKNRVSTVATNDSNNMPHYQKPKIIMILRNPIDRAFSQYKMGKSLNAKDVRYVSDFDDLVYKSIEMWRRNGVTSLPSFNKTTWGILNDTMFDIIPKRMPYFDLVKTKLNLDCLWRGVYIEQIKYWLPYFRLNQDLLILNFETVQNNQTMAIQQILEFLNVTHLLPSSNDDNDNGNIKLNNDTIHKDYSPGGGYKVQDQGVSITTRLLLERLYRPYNNELADLLGEEWRNIWNN